MNVLVVGTGLIGTSIAMALRERAHTVWLADSNVAHLRRAEELCRAPAHRGERPDVTVVAVPPGSTAEVVAEHLSEDGARTVTDTASVKGSVIHALESARDLPSDSRIERYVGGHPLAGRERGGPHRSRADLFAGRAWVLTPTQHTSSESLDAARAIVSECGATPVVMTPEEHDHALAITSHLPQLMASALAAQLADQPDALLEVVGQGLRDMTRIAAADPELWADIAQGNAAELSRAVDALLSTLREVSRALGKGGGRDAVRALVEAGRTGHERLPGKHGGAPRSYRIVGVIVPDRPGQLARLFGDIADAGVNVEDVRVEHAPGLPMGVIEVFVGPESADTLRAALTERGWKLAETDGQS